MADPNPKQSNSLPPGAPGFETTHWSLVLATGENGSERSRLALESLFEQYWFPLYSFVRRQIPDAHEARDITQEFFTYLLEKNTLAVASPDRGRFRNFLLASMKNFLSNQRQKASAIKRGGGRRKWSLDFDDGESRFNNEPADDLTPERHFDRQWALTLLDNVLKTLKDEFTQANKSDQFDAMKKYISSSPTNSSYRELGDQLGMTENAASVAVHRLRKRYRNLLRTEITKTVAGPGEVDDEIANLFQALG